MLLVHRQKRFFKYNFYRFLHFLIISTRLACCLYSFLLSLIFHVERHFTEFKPLICLIFATTGTELDPFPMNRACGKCPLSPRAWWIFLLPSFANNHAGWSPAWIEIFAPALSTQPFPAETVEIVEGVRRNFYSPARPPGFLRERITSPISWSDHFLRM